MVLKHGFMERNLIPSTAFTDPTSRRYLFSFYNLVFCFLFVCVLVFFVFLIMATEKDDSLQSVSVMLDGKNYSYWSYVMKNFIKYKKMLDMLVKLL